MANHDVRMLQQSSRLRQDISSLYLSQRFSDIAFIVEGEKLYAHKIVLGVRSKYFEKLFSGYSAQASESEIILPDVCLIAFKLLLQYIYTDSIAVEQDNIDLTLKVLCLSNKYGVEDLQIFLSKKLSERINADNVDQIMQKAELYNLSELYDTCLIVLLSNMQPRT